jgi:hypothetical protein
VISPPQQPAQGKQQLALAAWLRQSMGVLAVDYRTCESHLIWIDWRIDWSLTFVQSRNRVTLTTRYDILLL